MREDQERRSKVKKRRREFSYKEASRFKKKCEYQSRKVIEEEDIKKENEGETRQKLKTTKEEEENYTRKKENKEKKNKKEEKEKVGSVLGLS